MEVPSVSEGVVVVEAFRRRYKILRAVAARITCCMEVEGGGEERSGQRREEDSLSSFGSVPAVPQVR